MAPSRRRASLADVVEVGVLVSDPDDFAGMNGAWTAWFPVDTPARSAAERGRRPGVVVSIRMAAFRS